MSVELIEELKTKTVPQLKSYAKKNKIDIFGSNTKKEIIEVIMSWKFEGHEKENENIQEPKKKVAIYSSKNLYWSGVGSLKTGYNIVTEEESEKWLLRKEVRIASPEEVSKYYGKKE